MEEGKICYKLELMLRLIDTTTGIVVDEKDIHFQKDGKTVYAHTKGEGCFIFIGDCRENGLMQIEVYGFEPKKVWLDYEHLDSILPSMDIFLIPSENRQRGEALLTLTGTRSGLEAVEALHPGRPITSIRDFDAKKRVMTVLSPNRRMNLENLSYGLLNVEQSSFQDIEIVEELTDKKVRLRKPLEAGYSPNAPICRIIYGQVEEDGSYILRVRDDGSNLKYLVKYILNGDTRYKLIDFHELEGVRLDE